MKRYQSRHSEYHLNPKQLHTLIAGTKTDRDQLLVSLLILTGMRRAEARTLQVRDLDLTLCRIVITNGKGGKTRIVFFPQELRKLILAVSSGRQNDYLFPGKKGGPLTLRSINNIVAGAGRRAGMTTPNPHYKNITPHLLRHSFARNWKRSNGSLESLQKILGHSSFSTTMDLYGTESIADTQENYACLIQALNVC